MHELGAPASRVPEASQGDRLESWKEIAAYLKRDVTTVQRWEKREAMPVHRHLHERASSVYAFQTDLDAWARSRTGRAYSVTPLGRRTSAADPSFRRATRWALTALIVTALGVFMALSLPRSSADSSSNPLDGARIALVTHFEGTEHAAALSGDGQTVAFLSDRDGRTDIWVTRLGTGQFANLTRGRVENLENPSVRSLGFSPDGSLVTFWRRRADAQSRGEIATWAVPLDGGAPRPYLEGAAEFDWSDDGTRLVYHTPGPGDPTFVRDAVRGADRLIFTAPQGLHAHFPLWSPHDRFIYFVQGSVADAMDVWRISPAGGVPERLTHHDSRVSHPVMLDAKRLLYLATDHAGGGPWLYLLDVDRRAVSRLSTGVDTYTSLSASNGGRRVVATLTRARETLWRLPIPEAKVADALPTRIPLPTGPGAWPRLGPGYLVYVSAAGGSDTIWKLAGQRAAPLWSEPGSRLLGGPAIAPDGRQVAFCVEREGRSRLMVVQADGSQARTVTGSLALQGPPAWAPDGQSIAVAASDGHGPRLFAVSLDGRSSVRSPLEYGLDPAWSPDGRFIAYSGPDVGTTFRIKALQADGSERRLPDITLTRGARALRFLPGRRALVVLRGEIPHKDLWVIDVDTGAERQLTRLPADFDVRDFDIAADGRELVLGRVQEQSDIVLIDFPRR